MLPFEMQDDALGNRTDVIPISDSSIVVMLAAGIAKLINVPQEARVVLFSATGNFWLRLGSAPTLPSADITDGSAPSLNPCARIVRPGQSLGLVAATDCAVNLAFYG